MSGLEDSVWEIGDVVARIAEDNRTANEEIAELLRRVVLRLDQLNETIHRAELARQADAASAREGRKGKAK